METIKFKDYITGLDNNTVPLKDDKLTIISEGEPKTINYEKIKGSIEVTYSELVSLINSSELIPLQYYTITDYQTVHYIPETNQNAINSGSTEPLILFATSNNTIDKEVISTQYPEDVIYYDWNENNWLTDTSFGDDVTIISGFKGVIYRRYDTKWNNDIPYDFRQVKFRRWNTNDGTGYYNGIYEDSDGVTDSNDYIDVLTFNFNIDGYNRGEVQNNVFKLGSDNTTLYAFNGSLLLNNVFNLQDEWEWYQVVNNNFGSQIYNNTFIDILESNNFIFHFYDNICQEMYYTTFGHYCSGNVITNSDSNKIGDQFENNTITGNFFRNNTIGNIFRNNTFDGSYFTNNHIYNNFEDNQIGSRFESNIISNNFEDNQIGDWFIGNVIDNNVRYILTDNNLTFRNNHITGYIQGSSGSPIVLNQPEYNTYHYTETYRRPDNTIRLKYYDNTDTLVIKSPTV